MITTVWFPLENTELKFADLSGNQLPINFKLQIGLKIPLVKLKIFQALRTGHFLLSHLSPLFAFISSRILHAHVPPWNVTSCFSKLISNWKSNPWLFYQCRVILSSCWGHVFTLMRLGRRSCLACQHLYSKLLISHSPREQNNGKGMLFSVEQAFVGRDEIQAPLKTPALEASGMDEC